MEYLLVGLVALNLGGFAWALRVAYWEMNLKRRVAVPIVQSGRATLDSDYVGMV